MIKALTLTQPWATLVAIGAKKIETRSWATSYRGPLLIHAAAGYGKGGMRAHKELCGTEPFRSVLNETLRRWHEGCRDLRDMAERPFMPLGAIVAVCRLVACVPTTAVEDGFFGGPRSIETGVVRLWKLTDQERAFGDYSPGRWAWLLTDIRAMSEPIPCKGALGLWEPDLFTQMTIKRQQIAMV